jgi:ribosomal protein S18 acetylase RimI-like enzyme
MRIWAKMGNDVIKRLEWDSECFGYEVGTASIGVGAFNYDEFISEAKAYQLVYIFSKNNLTSLPFDIKKVDEKITLKKDIQPSFNSLQGKREPIENYSPSGTIVDLDAIESMQPANDFKKAFLDLALISGEYSRFRTDERLKNQEFERLYRFWADRALVEDDKGFALVEGGEVRGMITLTTVQDGTYRISLLAVHPGSRNQGMGRALLSKALTTGIDSGSRTLLVTTQRANIAAMRLYRNAGFEVMDSCNVYHWWRG